jgi:hypothetical protein
MAVAGERTEAAKKGLLRGVLGERRIARDAPGGREGRRSGQARERGESLLVAPARAFDERRFVGGGRRGRRNRGRPRSLQEPLSRKASKFLTAESARRRARSRKLWILPRCASVRIGWISVEIFAKRTAPSA